MPRLAALFARLSQAVRRPDARHRAPSAEPSLRPATRRVPDGPPVKRRRPGPKLLEQLAMDLGPERPRWTFSRLAARTPHHARIVEHLEFARRFFPELAEITIHVGLAQKRGVLGWGSLDPDRPGVWVRPRRLYLFTIAHEYTHLLQARGLVPRGERQCDLHALARTPLLIDHPPGYLKLPRELRRARPTAAQAQLLCACARRALAARAAGDRRYLATFEREIAEAAHGA
jgi:hypothetical protein